MNQNVQTVAETARKRIERLAKQEKNLDLEISRVQKRIDGVPKLKDRLEQLKDKKKAVGTRRKAELSEIEQLTKIVTDGGLTLDTA